MKLNVAAERRETKNREGRTKGLWGPARTVGLIVAVGLFLTGSAMALDSIDLSEPAEAVGAGECPKLTQIKYPFLSCSDAVTESKDNAPTWANTRQIPIQTEFVEGRGYFGDELNQN